MDQIIIVILFFVWLVIGVSVFVIFRNKKHFEKYFLVYWLLFTIGGIVLAYIDEMNDKRELQEEQEIMKPCQIEAEKILKVCRERL